jgi:prolyl 4-hydroxylase
MLVLTILLSASVAVTSSVNRRQPTRMLPLAFAGGFGASSSKKTKKGKEKKRKGGLTKDLVPKSTTATKSILPQDDSPKLDKWGLPPPTVEDLFPPMPPGTELIPVDPKKSYSLADIRNCMKEHIDLQLERYFDESGVEKNHHPVAGKNKPIQVKLLHQSPPVLEFQNFFTSDECNLVQEAVEGAYQVDSATFTGALSTRTSTSWFCNYSQVPTLLAKANHLLNIPLEQMEEPQIVRYQQGQQFSWHYDEVPAPQLKNGGQRLATLLVYLNDIPSGFGGGTMFRDLVYDGKCLTMQPKKGSALLFFPAFADGRPDDRTLHKGEVMQGDEAEKWIIQMWIHERSYQAVLPPGNTHDAAKAAFERISNELGYHT